MTLLLQEGADVNARGGEYGNALYAASARGYVDIVKLLLEAGADINAQGGLYGSAFQVALKQGHGEVVRILQQHTPRTPSRKRLAFTASREPPNKRLHK